MNYLQKSVKGVFDTHQGTEYLLGLSGGVDSVVLFYLMKSLGVNFKAIYIHHGLSENADKWSSFCKNICDKNNVEYIQENVSVKKEARQSLENEARILRYKAYKKNIGNATLVLGHHADDLAESMLMNMLNRSGLKGLSTMPFNYYNEEYGVEVLRPFLGSHSLMNNPIDKKMIEDFAKENNLENIFDESNLSSDYSRNFLRNEVIPLLKEKFGNILKPMAKTNLEAQEVEKLIQNDNSFTVKKIYDGFNKVSLDTNCIEDEFLLSLSKSLNNTLKGIDYNISLKNCESIIHAIKSKNNNFKLKLKNAILFVFKGDIYIVNASCLSFEVINEKTLVLNCNQLRDADLSLSKFLKSEDDLRKRFPAALREYCSYVVYDGKIKSMYNSHGDYFFNNKVIDYFVNNRI